MEKKTKQKKIKKHKSVQNVLKYNFNVPENIQVKYGSTNTSKWPEYILDNYVLLFLGTW